MTEYKAAVIGCGRMARGHMQAYEELGIPIVAGADISEDALQAFAEETGAQGLFTDYKRMLAEVQPDLVSVVTHDALHSSMVVAAAQAGTKGIVCEKPMAMDLAEADAMLAACRASGSRLTISHQRLYMPQYAHACALIEGGAIGRVISAEASLKAGCLMTDGTHMIHMLLALLGNPDVTHLLGQVDGHAGYEYFGHRCENAGIAFLAFANRVKAQLVWGWLTREPEARGQQSLDPGWSDDHHRYHYFIIHGDAGRLELYGDVFPGTDLLTTPMLRIFRGEKIEEIEVEWPAQVSAIGLEIQDLIRTIETGAPHPLDGENGRKVTEVMMGIYESARRRSVVRFPVEALDNPFLAMCATGDFPPQKEEADERAEENVRERWRGGSRR